ncbi:fec operon regulator FecR [Pigmentiphaga humi]|uniref:Fec operon regulator FecR n=1 Tax=Pigmentiphaga humi TaxID=2478468 RepID=A0A3P4AYL9_9BURK|nr:FecR domain-containing protein [Pigmentiphaga humi]VCU68456.1 fec operon regulator FecR [Pigmentiphaga humi]
MSRAAELAGNLPPPDHKALGEAADWLVRIQSGPLSPRDQRALLAWRRASQRHEEAWRRAEDVLGLLGRIPPELGREVLPKLAADARGRSRRRALAMLVAGAGAVPLAWLAARGGADAAFLLADHATALGEVRELALPDGTRIVLNTRSAIDVRYDDRLRRVVLRAGEILVETAPDTVPVKRPFLVETAQGRAQALGTRYTVRQFDAATGVAVYDGRVALRRTGQAEPFAMLSPGQSLRFSANWKSPLAPAEPADTAWQHGMLAARSMRLDELLVELGRYRRGLLYSADEVAALRVSGAFPLHDIDASLDLLAATMPVRIVRRTPYWVAVHGVRPSRD